MDQYYIDQIEGKVGTSPEEVTFHGRNLNEVDRIKTIIIRNNHSSQYLHISFDGGREWFTINPEDKVVLKLDEGEEFKLVRTIVFKGSGEDTDYQILLIIRCR